MKYYLVLLFCTAFGVMTSQISFTKVPQDKQLFGRDLQTNYGTVQISGVVNAGANYDLQYSSWAAGEPNNNPNPENAAEMVNNSGKWNDRNANDTQGSYVEYEGSVTSLGDLIYLGEFGGHSYFRNTQDLNWNDAKQAAENLGGYLASIHTIEENTAIINFGFFRGWIGLYQDTNSSNYSEPSGGWKWVASIPSEESMYENIIVEFLRNGTIVNTYNQQLSYSQDLAEFNIEIPILAELAKYRVKVYFSYEGTNFLVKDADDLVAGDVYIVQGQSNAVATSYSGSSDSYLNDYLRAYSGGYTSSSSVINDDQWYYAQGDGNENSGGNAGQWGLALAKMIKDEINIPIAIFNGAHGGQPIGFFDRPNNYNSSTDSNYGRMYHRLNETGLRNSVRAVLWSQGEADSFSNGLSTQQYKGSFETLISYWEEDFPSIEKYFIFQTRDCDCGTVSTGRKKIKEAQRLVANENANIFIMPTSGMQVHSDNCHFPFVNGYEKFAQRIFPIVKQQLYGTTFQEQFYAPMLVSMNVQGNILEIVTDSESLMTNSNNTSFVLGRLNNDFIFSDNTSIVNFELSNNKIIFQLSQAPSNSAKLSLIGKYADLASNITNTSGVEMVSFSDLAINQNSSVTTGDNEKSAGLVYTEDGDGNVFRGQLYRRPTGETPHEANYTRGGNGNSNDYFGNIGPHAADLTVSDRNPSDAAGSFGGFTESGHPLYDQGDGNFSQISEGHGALARMSFTANAYNRASGLGSVALGFNTLSGPQVGSEQGINGGNVGQFSAGWASRAIGNISTATGFRNTASGQASVALGNYNYATGDSSISLGKENWAQGASTIAIGFQNRAAGGGSVALGQENKAWGTTNFTAGYQNVAGDITSAIGVAGSATALGHGTFAQGRSSFSANKFTSATNQASAALGLATTADNFGMLAVGVNNAAGIGDTTVDPNDYGGYYYADGNYTGSTPGVAFVVGNGDIDSATGNAGSNPSNAFSVNYDGSATLSGELTVDSDARLKANITSLGNTLSKLLLLDGKSYTLKSDESVEKIGLLAQEIQRIFPELVKQSGDDEGTLSVNYQGLIPILINAIKEQQKELETIQNEFSKKQVNLKTK